ncbi:predicted protein [Streptomyces viridosporus ATCC 14672]|uniref:Predicted protein n=1 Tax=Streptomyces viridosporus (strain ATCC 14672 / DSM 40746 / JCM 4963 / KCTC 9882 / NRRL B-12104 / FH 1290) TaxID=566461 RepID=D6A3B5_STRV1|nr:predicted protein [Streptomyces viridosporus ATCC 14672]
MRCTRERPSRKLSSLNASTRARSAQYRRSRQHVFRVPRRARTKAAPATVAAVGESLNHQWK